MIIRVQNLVKRYGDLLALDHFGLEIKEGEIFGLLGPNGSGKTTAINCMLSLLKYDKGTIEIFGKPMSPDAYDTKRNIGVVMQNVAVFNEQAIDFVGLQDFRKFLPKKLSGGLLRRLNIACGIAHKPKLIFLDEPTVAVDPQSRNNILEGIQRLNREGATIVYTSHYMEEVEQICSRIAIIDKGKTLATGTKDELKSMIKTGETITAEIFALTDGDIEEVRGLPHVTKVTYDSSRLRVHCSGGKHNLIRLLDKLKERDISFGKVFSEPPTLNDVFLEITGKELRD